MKNLIKKINRKRKIVYFVSFFFSFISIFFYFLPFFFTSVGGNKKYISGFSSIIFLQDRDTVLYYLVAMYIFAFIMYFCLLVLSVLALIKEDSFKVFLINVIFSVFIFVFLAIALFLSSKTEGNVNLSLYPLLSTIISFTEILSVCFLYNNYKNKDEEIIKLKEE